MLSIDGYWTPREKQSAVIDFTAGTGEVWYWYCTHEKVSIREVGVILSAASGSVGTAAVAEFRKTYLNGDSPAILRPHAKVTFAASLPAGTSFVCDLDAGTNGVGLVRREIDFPELVRGEKVSLVQTTQGVSGTQSGVAYLIYVEKEADTR